MIVKENYAKLDWVHDSDYMMDFCAQEDTKEKTHAK